MESNNPAPEGGRACLHCNHPIPKEAHGLIAYCAPKCRNAAYKLRHDYAATARKYRAAHPEQFAQVRRKSRLADVRRYMLQGAKSRAKSRGLPFNLTLDDLGPLPEYCPVLGIPLEIGTGLHTDGSPSLDKIIPQMGYVKGNVLIISMRANRLKSNATPTEMRLLADFYENHITKNWMKGGT